MKAAISTAHLPFPKQYDTHSIHTDVIDHSGESFPVEIALPTKNVTITTQDPDIVEVTQDGSRKVFRVKSSTRNAVYNVKSAIPFAGCHVLTCNCQAARNLLICKHVKHVKSFIDGHKNQSAIIKIESTGAARNMTKPKPAIRDRHDAKNVHNAVKVPYLLRHVAKQHGGRWNPGLKMWVMPSKASKTIVEAELLRLNC